MELTYNDIIKILEKFKYNKISITTSDLSYKNGLSVHEVRFFNDKEDFIVGIKQTYDTEKLYTINTEIIYE